VTGVEVFGHAMAAANASSAVSMQKSASSMIETHHDGPRRMNRLNAATRWMKPRAIGRLAGECEPLPRGGEPGWPIAPLDGIAFACVKVRPDWVC
jgi:hypothetical protein